MTTPIDFPAIRGRFLKSWLIIRILALALNISGIQILTVFFMSLFFALGPLPFIIINNNLSKMRSGDSNS